MQKDITEQGTRALRSASASFADKGASVSIAECSKKIMGTGVELVEAGNGKHGVRPSLFADEKGLI